MIFLFETLATAAVYAYLSWKFFNASEKNIGDLEKLCRNKVAGLILSLPCALLCVPLAIPVSPGFLIPLLYPLAVILPVLCYFYIDYYASRGLAFLLILWAYDAIHAGFEAKIPGSAVVTVIALILGTAGIWLSAKPCSLRDLLRKAAASKKYRYPAAAAAAAGAITAFYVLIMNIGVLVK